MSDQRDTLPAESGIGRVALRVGDAGAVGEFYRTVVGLEVLADSGSGTTLGVGETPLLRLVEDAHAPDRRPDEAGLFHTAFRVPTRADLGAALARIEAHAALSGASDHGVSEALYLSDPEENGVEIYCDTPRQEWPETEGHVRLDTRPSDLAALREAADGGSATDTAPPGTTVGHVHLETTSLSRAEAFYVDALGLRVRQRWGGGALFLAAGEYHHHVGLNTWAERASPRNRAARGLDWFELVVPDAGAVAAAHDRFTARHHECREIASGFAIRDPDGVELRVVVEDGTGA